MCRNPQSVCQSSHHSRSRQFETSYNLFKRLILNMSDLGGGGVDYYIISRVRYMLCRIEKKTSHCGNLIIETLICYPPLSPNCGSRAVLYDFKPHREFGFFLESTAGLKVTRLHILLQGLQISAWSRPQHYFLLHVTGTHHICNVPKLAPPFLFIYILFF